MVDNQKFFHGMTIKRAATRAINIMDYYDWGILENAKVSRNRFKVLQHGELWPEVLRKYKTKS